MQRLVSDGVLVLGQVAPVDLQLQQFEVAAVQGEHFRGLGVRIAAQHESRVHNRVVFSQLKVQSGLVDQVGGRAVVFQVDRRGLCVSHDVFLLLLGAEGQMIAPVLAHIDDTGVEDKILALHTHQHTFHLRLLVQVE